MEGIAGFEKLAQDAIRRQLKEALEQKFKKEESPPKKMKRRDSQHMELIGKNIQALRRSSSV